MTLAEQRREAVLRFRDEGLAEDEIAEQVGISEAAVMRILDREEPPPVPYREPVWTPKKAPQRTKAGSDIAKPIAKTKTTPAPRAPRKVAECGTVSGQQSHRRKGEEVCSACKEAIRLRAEKRRHDEKKPFESEELALMHAASLDQSYTVYLCECQSWHVRRYGKRVPKEEQLAKRRERDRRNRAKWTPEQHKASWLREKAAMPDELRKEKRRQKEAARRERRRSLDTLQLTG